MDLEISTRLCALDEEVRAACAGRLAEVDRVAEKNALRVHGSFVDHHVALADFSGTTGYGYDDRGRDNLDRVFAGAVGAEDALCRPQFMNGTHAITVALFGMLRKGDVLLSVTGSPYDTLHKVVGIEGEGYGSLQEYGIIYREIPLLPDGSCDLDEIRRQSPDANVVYIQRSRGYDARRMSFGRAEIEPVIRA